MKKLLTESDQTLIKEAVAAAEQRTSGEIVPYIVPRSGDYEVALWRGAGICTLIASTVVLLVWRFYGWDVPIWVQGVTPVLVLMSAGVLGAIIVRVIPALHRWLAGSERLDRTVNRRAVAAFMEKEIFLTRERTGILLFVSVFEHRIQVIGDSGINAQVMQEDWADVVRAVREGVSKGNLAEGLIAGIDICGTLLELSGLNIRPDDENELPDDVSFGT
ncbi:MAG: hypothetical protein OXI38_10095 [Bacteroidota bacterium]|nr:hypothetical protein [Bacteroidota bacterium]